MTVKEYLAPDAEFIEFDNSDVIVTSWHDLACTSSQDATAYCTNLGDSTQPNECKLNGRNCTGTSKCTGEISSIACAIGWTGQTCSTKNQVFYNSAPGRHDKWD